MVIDRVLQTKAVCNGCTNRTTYITFLLERVADQPAVDPRSPFLGSRFPVSIPDPRRDRWAWSSWSSGRQSLLRNVQ